MIFDERPLFRMRRGETRRDQWVLRFSLSLSPIKQTSAESMRPGIGGVTTTVVTVASALLDEDCPEEGGDG